ncbi:1,4-dihydroxy-2-naphthoate octaprenyltransferase [Flavobacteriaceae bacterium]|nr:1,4-dihydroxy-2-naphthoate octaprenyltransferase [Flavobacteriaceae bacterium]
MNNIKYWIKASRLRTLPLSLSGVLLGCALAVDSWWQFPLFWWAMATTIGFQVLSNFANDYGDGVKGTDAQRTGEARMVASGLITAKQMKRAVWISGILTFFSATIVVFMAFGQQHYLLSFLFFNLTLLALWAAVRYTVGGGAYGYSGWGDVFVFVFFGLLGVLGSSVLFIKQIDYYLLLPAITVGLLSVAVLNLNNMRDADQDALIGKRTLAVRMGFQKAKIYHNILVLGALVSALLYAFLRAQELWSWAFIFAFIPLGLHLIRVQKISNPADYDAELKKVALSTFLYALLMALIF